MLRTRGNKLTWLGHSTFRITTPSGKVVLVDPWVAGNPACPEPLKKFDRLDVMLISHGHGDHFGDAVALARAHKPQIVAIYETCLFLGSKGISNTLPMSKGGTQKAGEIEVSMVHAVHSNSIEDDGRIVYGGEPCGYMKLIGEMYTPELACLPIGDLFTMGPREAALAIRLLGVRQVVPMHYGTFPALTGTPEALRDLTQDIAGLEIHALKPGDTLG